MIPRNAAIGAGVLALTGLAALAHYSATTRAAQPAAVAPATPVPGSYLDPVAPAPVAVAAAPVGERVVYRDRVVYRTRTVAARPRYYVHKRSKKHSAEIIGGSAVGGAGIGALVGGKKGALIGGLVGGAAGTVYDRKTHKKVVRQ
ncbi:MAG TPA: hypothetical protein VIK51_00970 [Vicinamibacteria bacterium]|jgi:uncharacterized protein YcfJ